MSQSASPRNQGYSNNNKASPGGGGKHNHKLLEDSPIKELVCVVEETKPEQWQKRAAALADLVAQIPSGAEYHRREAWYNSPPTLRHLHRPIGELLKDPRSTVVKRTCEALSQIFAKCQDDAKYLFKDLMPVVLNVHAQTVQVIRSQVQAMVLEAITIVPCKMAMPIWLERLKTDKSRTVREACVLYLGMGLKHWTNDENVETSTGAPYITEDNWILIGTAFIKTLRDPSPAVRAYGKSGIATVRDAQPELWNNLIRDRDGPAGSDLKLQKWLIKVSETGEEFNATSNEELSVASRYSHYSVASKNNRGAGAPSTPNSRHGSGGGFNANRPSSRGRAAAVPVQISVGSKEKSQQPPRQMRGLGPPLRRPFAHATDPAGAQSPSHNNNNNNPTTSGGYPMPVLGTPPRPPIGASSPLRQQRSPSPSPRRTEPRHTVPLRSRSHGTPPIDPGGGDNNDNNTVEDNCSVASRSRAPPTPEAMGQHQQQQRVIDLASAPQHQHPQDPEHVTASIDQTLAHLDINGSLRQTGPESTTAMEHHETEEQGPFIASMNELKQHASKRRSRRSITLQQRWSNADQVLGSPTPMTTIPATPGDAISSLGGGASIAGGADHTMVPAAPSATLPEHYIIAEQLLRVHKTHVDQIMETLKIEMDTLRDFEQTMEQEQAPSPDQVLDYFESVGLCLDQRTTAGNIMQREMDRISKGAFQNVHGGNNTNNHATNGHHAGGVGGGDER